MFGDYYTNTILSGSPRTTMIGNQIESLHHARPQPQKGAVLVLVLSALLLVLMSYYLVVITRQTREASGVSRARSPGPSRRVDGDPSITWLYVAWSIVPVLIAVAFSFNNGRSRRSWQGFSVRWWCTDEGSVAKSDEPALAVRNSLVLGVLTIVIAVPLGVAPGDRAQPAGARARPRRPTAHAAALS